MPPTDSTTRALEARRARGIQVAVMLALLVVVLRALPLTRGFFIFPLIESFAYDSLFDYTRPEPPADIAIVAIDDETLKELGRFQSWHRDKYAELLDKLPGAKVVAFDILFPEEDTAGDEVFARAMQRHGRVVLASHWTGASEAPPGKWTESFGYPHSAGRLPRGKPGETLLFPTVKLATQAAAIGYVDIDPDSDAVFRRFKPLANGPNGLVYPHFGTAIAAVAAGVKGEEISRRADHGGLELNRDNPSPLPINGDGSCLINYCGPMKTVPTFSFLQVLRDPATQEALQGKIVIVGATAAGLYDIRPAVYRSRGRMFYGVETNANIVNTLLHRKPLKDSGNSLAWGAFALLLGLLVGIVVWTTGEAVAATLSLLVLLLIAAPSFFVAFHLLQTWIPYGGILLATALPLLVGLPERLTAEKRLIQRQFDVYVSPDVLQELMSAPDLVRQSRRRPVTLMFCDVRGSTTLSEKIAPEVWIAQLNEYLTQMSLAIFSLDGYLDKFMGDGIMAVWNAFGTQEDDHAELAVRAGMQMLRRLELLNKKWEQMEDRALFRIGIGLHSGEAVMANVGSEDRMQFTAIGDVVNTASRIEGMCKQFKAEFIISEDTARLVRGRFPLRELGETEVRGRAGTIKVFEVVQQPANPTREGDQQDGTVRTEEAAEAQE